MHIPESSPPEPIAIIGIGCRFPGGAHDPERFWALLREGVDAIVEVPPDRWSIASYYSPDASRPETAVTRWGGFLQQRVDEFDALFFAMSPREAAHLDPMQRWMLEVTWEALEDGGVVPEHLAATNTGVFVGAFTEDIKIMRMCESNRPLIDAHTGTGSAMTMVANRLSYVFDLRGPSVALDTACSSSLVAVHLACQSLWTGECSLALAGGVNAMFKPEATIAESKAGMLSPDGRCKTFDARANGYVRGEGAAVVVLKPLTRALADGDPIYALIRGSAVNQDGHTNGITVPSHAAQRALMEEACRRAHVSPGQLQYVEAHGTGTPVGDPIEANALAAALSVDRPAGNTCVIGSVKTNIGHLEAAAGIAGLIKAALCLTHRQIPPHLHLQQINPQIPLDNLCVRIPHTLEPWPEGPGPALAAVNSFGFGGTNAHVILQEAPPPQQPTPPAEPASLSGRAELTVLSARSPQALQALARRCREWIASQEPGHDVRLADLAYTTTMRRSHHDYRLSVVARSTEELAERLETYLTDEARAAMAAGRKTAGRQPKLAFVFSGMGPQWWAMGRQLLEQEPVFRAAIERCDALMRPYAGWSLLQEMMADEAQSRMTETQIAQPANFALQVGLAELWRSWGIQPDAIVGHSAGEVAAAYQAGALSFDEALRVIFHRSRLQHLTTGQGKLVAVGLSLGEARAVIRGYDDSVSIAAVNSPSTVTLVGDPAALDEIVEALQRRDVFCRYLAVNVPYHSHYMDPLRDELLDVLRDLDLCPVTVPLVSTVTGNYASGDGLDAGYWWRNVRDPVLFAEAMDRLIDDGYEIFLEVSPHPVLGASIGECLAQSARPGKALASLRRKSDERATMLESLGTLYTLGFPTTFAGLQHAHPRLVRMPTYPWQRERYWDESAESVQDRLGEPVHPLLGRRSTAAHPAWDVTLDRLATPFLEDHRIQGAVVFPGAAYVEMGIAAARQLLGAATPAIELHNVEFRKALFWSEGADPALQLILHPGGLTFDIYSRVRSLHQEWRHHARGTVGQGQMRAAPTTALAEVRRRCTQETPAVEAYAQFAAMGLHYGPCFQGIARLWRGDGEALALLRVPDAVTAELPAYHVHPAVLDACFQALIASVATPDGSAVPGAYMPITIDRVRVYRPLPAEMWVHTRLTEQQDTFVTGDLQLCDETGRVALEVQGLRALSLEQRGSSATEKTDDLFYELSWQPEGRLAEVTDGGSPGSGTPGRWLIFADEGGVGRSLATLLEERGESCVLVTPGESYHRGDHGTRFHLNPACPDEFQRLLVDACGAQLCRGIVYLWGLQSPATAALDADALQAAQALGCLGLMHCVQAVERIPWRASPHLWVVTRGAQSVGATDGPVAVAQAPLWGLARTIGHQEHGGLWGGVIDLDPAVPSGEVSLLLEEIWAGPSVDQVALRDKQRYIPHLARRRDLGQVAVPPRFRPDGSYLITGGLGGLGLQLAAWMIEQGARRLILLSRTPLPARSTWSAVAEGTPEAARIAAVHRLEAMGASIHVAAVDVAEEHELGAFLEQYRREGWPPIRGVVHSAGVTYSQLLLTMNADSFQRVLRPKVQGAWLLHRLLQDEPLDFFVLFSSVASLGFSLGLGAYAAGNAFLDALAHHRRTQGLPALSINWGPWAEVGMASQPDLSAYFTQRGLLPLPPEQGMHCLAQLFGADQTQATVLAADWPVVRQHGYGSGRVPSMLDGLGEEQEAPETTERQDGGCIRAKLRDAVDEPARRDLLGSYLGAQVGRVLRLSESSRAALDLSEPLSNLGIDSLMAIELKNGIAADLDVAVSVVSFLQGASIADLADEVLGRLPHPGAESLPEKEQAPEGPAVQLDQLSDAAVDALLNMMLAEGTVHHE